MSNTLIVRSTTHYSGHVQGVGFRFTVLQIAKGYELSGFVENLSDGQVLLVAEGEAGEIDEFLAVVADRMSGYIRKADRTVLPAAREHRGFSIR